MERASGTDWSEVKKLTEIIRTSNSLSRNREINQEK